MSHGIQEDKTGMYGLCVFEAASTTDDELKTIFGKFGEIGRLSRSKDLVFICYKALEDAVQCFEEMKKQSTFRVKPAFKRANADKQDNQRRRDTTWDQNKGGEMNYKRNDNSNVQPQLRPMPDLKVDVPESQLSATIADNEIKDSHRVIVAHLHPHMEQSDIYRLCTKAQAQAVHIDMKSFTRSPYPTEYYAIVHVSNEADVRNIVRGLNNLTLNGYQLVVSPYEKLVEEGKKVSATSVK